MLTKTCLSYHHFVIVLLLGAALCFCVVNKSYSQAISHNKGSLEQAKDYYNSDQLEKAETLFRLLEKEFCTEVTKETAGNCADAKRGLIGIERRAGSREKAISLAMSILDLLDHYDIQNEAYERMRLYRYLTLDNLGLSRLERAGHWASTIREEAKHAKNWRVLLTSKLTLGDYEDAMGNYDEAINLYSAGVELAENADSIEIVGSQLIDLHNNLGVSYKKNGELDKAKAELETSLDLIHKLYGYENYKEGSAYINLGGNAYARGDLGLAAEYFKRAVEIYRSLMGDNSESLGASLNNLAATQYMLGNYELAAEYFEEAQRLKEKSLGMDHPDTAIGYSNLAAIHIINKEYESARTNYERSIAVRENVYGPNHPNLIEPIFSLGNLYSQQLKQNKQALMYYELALAIALNRLGPTHPVVTDLYLQMGFIYLEDGNYSKADGNIDRALKNLYGPYSFDEPLDPERSLNDPVALIRALAFKSIILSNRAEKVFIEDNKQSLMALKWAADLVDLVQRSFKNEASKLQLIEDNYSIYTGAVEILSLLYRETGNEKYMDQIFETIEESRSRIALEQIQKVNASKYAGVPARIIHQEENLKNKITKMQQELHREENKGLEKDTLRISALRDSIFYYKRDHDDFTDHLEETYPSYYQLKYDQSVISRADAQSLLQQDEVVLSYILGEVSAYVMVVTKENVNFVRLGSSTVITDLVIKLKEYVLSEKSEAYRQAAYELYTLLIQPAGQYITGDKIIVMADQALHYLPFELLLTEVPDHVKFSRYPYLVHDYVFSYAPSLTLLDKMLSGKEDNPRNLLALAPFSSEISREDKVLMDHQYSASANPLYLTTYETTSISSQFRSQTSLGDYLNPRKAELLMGENATFSGFFEKDLREYDFIHFATHAFINEEQPEFSAILLYPEEGNSGAAYVGDIYNLELDANLVVLGACQTGLGSIYKGEGLIGFTRAFIYAGASNLAVSMWRVSDQPTAYLMIDFYDLIRQGYDYNEALRQAKLNLISKPQFANPVNWAAFTLTGR
ncbi:CHAT domain-containing protein [Rhodohalobacter sp. 8-1]|uniref:CHAT domain-containing protein n=1 Tax=Rhodohalobacter sp. 8-1 TaxID=3131972 RepID=UPI0030ED7D48